MFFLALLICCQLITRLGVFTKNNAFNILFANAGNAAALVFIVYYSCHTHWYTGVILLNLAIIALAGFNYAIRRVDFGGLMRNFYYQAGLKVAAVLSGVLMFAMV